MSEEAANNIGKYCGKYFHESNCEDRILLESCRRIFTKQKDPKDFDSIGSFNGDVIDGEFKNMEFGKHIGTGVFGECFECQLKGDFSSPDFQEDDLNLVKKQKLVVKIFKSNLDNEKLTHEMIKTDAIYIKFDPNVVQSICHFHGKILKVFDEPLQLVGLSDSKTGFVLMLHHGMSLDSYVKNCRKGKLELLEIMELLRGIIKGADHIHRNHKVHRDLHTGNIFVNPERKRVVIGDLGCSVDVRNSLRGFDVDSDDSLMYPQMYPVDSFDPQQRRLVKGGCDDALPLNIKSNPGNRMFSYETTDIFAIGKIAEFLLGKLVGKDYGGFLSRMNQFVDSLKEEDEKKRMNFQDALRGICLIIRVYRDCEIGGKSEEEYMKDVEKTSPLTRDNEDISRIYAAIPKRGETKKKNRVIVYFSVSQKEGMIRFVQGCPISTHLLFGSMKADFSRVIPNDGWDYRFGKFMIRARTPFVLKEQKVEVSMGFEGTTTQLVWKDDKYEYCDKKKMKKKKKKEKKIFEEEEHEGEEEEEKDSDGKKKEEELESPVFDSFGGTKLHYAVAQNDMELVSSILKESPDLIAAQDIFGFTPILVSKWYGFGEMLDFLCSNFEPYRGMEREIRKIKTTNEKVIEFDISERFNWNGKCLQIKKNFAYFDGERHEFEKLSSDMYKICIRGDVFVFNWDEEDEMLSVVKTKGEYKFTKRVSAVANARDPISGGYDWNGKMFDVHAKNGTCYFKGRRYDFEKFSPTVYTVNIREKRFLFKRDKEREGVLGVVQVEGFLTYIEMKSSFPSNLSKSHVELAEKNVEKLILKLTTPFREEKSRKVQNMVRKLYSHYDDLYGVDVNPVVGRIFEEIAKYPKVVQENCTIQVGIRGSEPGILEFGTHWKSEISFIFDDVDKDCKVVLSGVVLTILEIIKQKAVIVTNGVGEIVRILLSVFRDGAKCVLGHVMQILTRIVRGLLSVDIQITKNLVYYILLVCIKTCELIVIEEEKYEGTYFKQYIVELKMMIDGFEQQKGEELNVSILNILVKIESIEQYVIEEGVLNKFDEYIKDMMDHIYNGFATIWGIDNIKTSGDM